MVVQTGKPRAGPGRIAMRWAGSRWVGVGGARWAGRRCRSGPESPDPSGPAPQGCFGPTAGRAAAPLCRAWSARRCGPRRYAGLRGRAVPLCRNAWAGPGRARHCCGLSRSDGPERAGRRVSGAPRVFFKRRLAILCHPAPPPPPLTQRRPCRLSRPRRGGAPAPRRGGARRGCRRWARLRRPAPA